ncbi:MULTISPECIES: hypothetical protein [unclassified Microbacterium]|uniref:hypothetical protein n=2 Tax=Microbacterium TaxID=33882 RepID=UPI0030199646
MTMTHDSDDFPSARLYWVGVDPVSGVPSEDVDPADEARRALVTAAEVEGLDPATMTGLRLAQQDARGDIGARYVAAFRVPLELDADVFTAAREARPWPDGVGFAPRWRLLFERFLTVGTPEPEGAQLVLVGMTPAADATAEQVEEFNAFYNGTHLPEVLHDWDWQRAGRYERRAVVGGSGPRYLAVYESGPTARISPRSAEGVPNYSSGPYAWEHRDTAWRLRYDVI